MHWSAVMARDQRAQAELTNVRGFLDGLYGTDLHAKRIASLAGATLGVMHSASLAVAMIGQALAQARGLVTKHAVKPYFCTKSKNIWASQGDSGLAAV
jgi:hypothetical protein